MTSFVLLLFLKLGNAGGPVIVEVPSVVACQRILNFAQSWPEYRGGYCVDRREHL